jgi:CTP synthase (UTP-ammonia lyase)
VSDTETFDRHILFGLVEYARNVAGITDAEHEESAPNAPMLLVSKLAQSLVGRTQAIRVTPGSILRRAYGCDEVDEQFACNYGLNPKFSGIFENGGLTVSGVDGEGNVRAVELTGHPFFVATLFLPQVRSRPGAPHPLIVACMGAARTFQASRQTRTRG